MTYQFSPVLPAGFENAQVKLAASEFKEGKGYIPVESDGKTHYYIDRAFQENNVRVPYDQLYAIYEFTVAEAGEYSFCFDLRVKDATERETYFSVDNGETIRLHHLITDANLKDATNSTYMTGYKVLLTAGTHTFKLSVSEDNKATIHFRNFYVLKTGEIPTPITYVGTAIHCKDISGLRIKYAVNRDIISFYEQSGYTVEYGIVAAKGATLLLENVTSLLDSNAQVTSTYIKKYSVYTTAGGVSNYFNLNDNIHEYVGVLTGILESNYDAGYLLVGYMVLNDGSNNLQIIYYQPQAADPSVLSSAADLNFTLGTTQFYSRSLYYVALQCRNDNYDGLDDQGINFVNAIIDYCS